MIPLLQYDLECGRSIPVYKELHTLTRGLKKTVIMHYQGLVTKNEEGLGLQHGRVGHVKVPTPPPPPPRKRGGKSFSHAEGGGGTQNVLG